MKVALTTVIILLTAACGPDSFDPSTPPVNKRNKDEKNDHNEDLEKKPTPTPTIEANVCGDGLNLAETSFPEKVFKLDPFTKTFKKITKPNSQGINTLVNFSGNLILQNSPSSVVISQGILALPNLNQTDMKSFLADAKARLEATTIPNVDRGTALNSFPIWADKGTCVLQPVTQLTKSGDLPLSLTFNQPIPIAVGPTDNFDFRTLMPLLKSNTVWSDITATILNSSDPKQVVGKAFLGSVSVDKTVDQNTPNLTSIKISYSFGGLANNKIMGLPLSATWTVDTQTMEITAIEIDSGIGKTLRFK